MARRYSVHDKAKAVGLALTVGPTRAALATGYPKSSIIDWRDSDQFAPLRDKTADEVAGSFWEAIQVGLAQVREGLLAPAPLRDKAIALGILYDKHALLTGRATSRTESRSERFTDSLSDEAKAQLRDAIDAWEAEIVADPDNPAWAAMADIARIEETGQPLLRDRSS